MTGAHGAPSSVAPMVHLVRHGLPAIDKQAPADQWELSADADHELERLRTVDVLPSNARWFSSPEPKAMATARALTDSSLGVVDGLREMRRPAEWLDDEWPATVASAMTEPDVPARPGWETGTATADRVTGVVRRIRESCGPEPVVLVGHGTAWTLLVARLTGAPPDVDAWTRLRLPDHCALLTDDAATSGQVVSAWGAWDR